MGFGIWYDDNDEVHILDANSQKMSLLIARDKARKVLADKSKEELLTALMDRMDVNDIFGFVTDDKQSFLPDEAPAEVPEGGGQ